MKALILKQGLRVTDGFFLKIFFSLHNKKKPFMGNKVCLWENIFFSFFLPDLQWKRYSGIETDHVQFSNIFSHKKPRTFRLEKKLKHKKNGSIEGEKKIVPQGFVQFLILSKIQKDQNTASTVFVDKKTTMT